MAASRRKRGQARLFTLGGYDYTVSNPRRLMLSGIVVIAGLVALLMFWPRGGEDVFASPAPPPCYLNCGTADQVAFPLPLERGSAEDAAFRELAQEAASADAFYGGYSANQGIPARFYAFIPSTSTTANPDYFEADGLVYLPARFLPTQAAGEFDAITSSDGESGRTVILGFPRDQVPDSQFIEIYGYLYWTAVRMNANATANAPVIAVQTWDPVSPSAIRQPASRAYPEPGTPKARQPLLLVRRDDLRLSVNRIEFTPDQTRVHITIVNLGTAAAASWDFSRATLLTGNNEVGLREFVAGGSDPASTPPQDILQSASLPPGGQADRTVVRSGYLFFGAVDATKEVTISLPDLNGSAAVGQGGDFMRIVIPAPAAPDPVPPAEAAPATSTAPAGP